MMNERHPLQLQRWQRKEKSGAAILDLIEESDSEIASMATITEEATAGPPGRGK
jgi:hypothetical protein